MTPQFLNTFHTRIAAKAHDNSEPTVLIVALGDSVTQGCMEADVMDFDAVYHSRLKRMLERRYPATTFSVINAGCGGESLPGGAARLARDVLRHAPDLVLIGYGLNDACAGGRAGLAVFKTGLAAMVTRIRTETAADVMLLTPNRMAAHDNDRVPAQWKPNMTLFTDTQNNGTLAAYAQAIRDVAAETGVALADVYAAWDALERDGTDTTRLLCNGINHPNADMHNTAAQLIMKAIEQ